MKDWADLLQAVAALLWPLIVFGTVLIFRKNVTDLLRRVRKGKLFGQELELESSLTALEVKSELVASELPPIAAPAKKGEGGERKETNIEGKILDMAARSPKAALMWLASEIEKQLRIFMAISGHHSRLSSNSSTVIAAYLGENGWLTRAMVETILSFWKIRNQLVHGYDVNSDHILRAIDSGMTILKGLEAVPKESNIIYHPGVDIYSDKNCGDKREGVRGLILETTSPGGAMKSHRIYPTTRTDYQKGKQVAWEWNMGRILETFWYRDPDTGEIKEAWDTSAEFIGRHVDDL